MRWRNCVLGLFALLCSVILASGPAIGAECSFSSPPQSLETLFSQCESAAGYSNYRIAPMDLGDEFEIDMTEAFKLTHDFSNDRDTNTSNKIEGLVEKTYCTGRIKMKTLAYVNETHQVEEGYAYAFYATELPPWMADLNDPALCNDPFDEEYGFNENDLRRTGILFLPGFQNYATPAEAVRVAEYYSSQVEDPQNRGNGKVFAVVLAPPSHVAVNMTQTSGLMCNPFRGGEEFCTLPREDLGDPDPDTGFGQLSFGAYGLEDGAEYFPTANAFGKRERSLGGDQFEYLTNGLLDPEDIRPTRNILWAYGMSAMRMINTFEKYFYANDWTDGQLYLGSFSLGGLTALISNEVDRDNNGQSTRIDGIFTFAAHAGIEDNFRVPGNNMGRSIITSGGRLSAAENARAPLIAWDCDVDMSYYAGTWSSEVVEKMHAGCLMSDYFSPLSYEPTFDPTRPILFTQGASDEPWSVRGLERTYEYLADYQGEEYVRMNLEADVDHKYFLGGVQGDYASTSIFPSDAINSWTSYPAFGDTVEAEPNFRNAFETFTNADWLNMKHSDFVDGYSSWDSPSLGWNRLMTTARSFVLAHSNYSNPNDVTVNEPPPPPVRALDLHTGVDLDFTVTEVANDTIVRYDMTACYAAELENTYDDLEIVFKNSPDKFWHVLPACEGEATTGTGYYTINITSYAYDYNSPCFSRSTAKYLDKCSTAAGSLDTQTAHDGFVGVPTSGPDPEGYICRTFAVEFKGPTSGYHDDWSEPQQITAWAELRAYDSNGDFQSGSSGDTETYYPSPFINHSKKYKQCVRPVKDEETYLDYVLLPSHDFKFTPEVAFPKTPDCNSTPVILDEWPKPVDEETVLDFTGYNVVIPSATSLETGDHGLTITTDCNFSIASTSTLAVDEGVNDATLSIVARNITVNGQIWNQTDESAAIRLIALDTITVGGLGEVSIRNNNRDGEDESGLIELSAQGDVEILGEINAQQKHYGGSVVVSGEDVTFGTDSRTVANAQSGATSYAGSITVWANDDLMVEWDSDPYQRAIFTAQGDSEDGEIDFTGCTIDPEQGDFDPSPTHHPYECPLTDILDLESVDWCDNYEDNDLCCQVGDPCGYGYDGACQCANSCVWDVMDCTGAPVGVQVSNLTDTETPVVGAECVIVDNETGEPVEPEVSTTSDANGFCWFESIENYQTYSVRVTHDDYLPTYLFNLPAPALPIAIMFPTALIGDVEQYFEIEIDPEDGIVVGFVFWSGGGGFEPVGCAEVTSDSGQNTVYYSDEYGPNPELTATSPVNSAFMLFNVPVGGPYEFTATTDEEEVYSTMPQVFASAVTINYLVYGGEYETNPTPAECE